MAPNHPTSLKPEQIWIVVITAIVVLLVAGTLILMQAKSRAAEARSAAVEVATRTARQIERDLTQNLAATYALAALVRQGQGKVRDFDAIAQEFLTLHPGVSALQLAPGGVIGQSIPLAGNEKAIGHNLLTDGKRNKEALLAMQTGKLTLAGPFELIQGGEAVIGRLPVYLGKDMDEFWGFTIALIRMADFLSTTEIEDLNEHGYAYQLWRTHPDTGLPQVFAHSAAELTENPISAAFDVPNGRWHLSLSPTAGWTQRQPLQIFLALLLSSAAAWGAYRYFSQLRRAELALIAAKDYAEALIATANVMVVELDPAGNLQRINPAAEAITGYTLDEIRGKNWFETIAPRQRYPEVWAEFEAIIARDGRIGEFENPIQTKSGEEKHISWRNSQIVEQGEIVGTLSFGLDITEQKATHDRLKQSETSLIEAQRLAHIGNWRYDLDTRNLFWSEEIFSILEFDPTQAIPCSHAFLARVHPNEQQHVKAAYQQFRQSYQAYELTTQLIMPDGISKYVSQCTRAVLDARGKPIRFVGTLQDVTLQTLQDMAFKESEERFRTIADYTYDWEYWQGNQQEMLYISPSCKRITGYSATEFISHPELQFDIIHPEDRETFRTHKHETWDKPHGELTFRILTKDSQVRWIAHGCTAVFSHDGKPLGRRGSNRDITDLKEAEQRAYQLAYFDSLTNLPNRRMLLDRLHHGLAQAKRFERALAIMFLDLDRFKLVNDTLGHDTGDKLLVEVAHRLAGCIRTGDTVARTGGDEFIIVLSEISQPADAATVADKILSAFTQPIELAGQRIDTSTSIGIAVYPVNGGDDAEALMKKADIAMYAAKNAGRNQYSVFTD